MIIDDKRFVKKELSWDELETSSVYISHRLQKYVMMTSGIERVECIVCLETGELYSEAECLGDVFEPVKVTLVVE